jgi:hypothetical protein
VRDTWCRLAAWTIAFTASLTAVRVAGAGETSGTRIIIGTATAMPGEQTSFAVTLATDVVVGGTQNDIAFAPPVRIAALTNGRPDCRLNPELGPRGPTFAFQPTDCDPAATCTAVRALVLAFNNVGGIPDGSLLYTCTVAIPADTPAAAYPLEISNVAAADEDGEPVDASGTSGAVIVVAPSPTPTQTPAATASTTPTATPRPANHDDGCAIAPDAQSGAWWLLLPVIVLARRRQRH